MAWEGVSFEEAVVWKQEVEQDARFLVTELRSHFNIEQQQRLWFLHVVFEYRSNRRERLRIQADVHTRERWESFARPCKEQADAAMQGAKAPSAKKQRAMANNSREEAST